MLESLKRIPAGGWLRMIVFGAVMGSFLDGLHTHSGTTSYPQPVFWLMAWWTPVLFAGAYTLLGVSWVVAVDMGKRTSPPTARSLGCLVVFCALYGASGYLPASNPIKLTVLLAGTIALVVASQGGVASIALGLIASALGPGTEVVLVKIGAFQHLQPDFGGIPMWLPGLYLASGPGAAPAMGWLATKSATSAQATSG